MKSKFLVFAAACLALVACKKDNALNNNEPTAPGRQVTISATVQIPTAENAPIRKVSPDTPISTTDNATLTFHWEAGDKVVLYNGNTYEMKEFTIVDASINGSNANFTGTALSDMSSYQVYYWGKNTSIEKITALIITGSIDTIQYEANNFHPCILGTGNADGFTLNSFFTVINIPLKGNAKVGKIDYFHNSIHSTTMTFGAGLQLTSDSTPVYMPLQNVGMDGFIIRIFDTNDQLLRADTVNSTILFDNYGKLVTFPALTVNAAPTDPNLLPGKFSVSASKQVQFTKANLYWDGAAYKFEASQTAFPTEWNANHVGHFFWTNINDYNDESDYYKPYADSKSSTYGEYAEDLFWCGIDNPLTVEGTTGLYTLTIEEWQYLLGDNTKRNGLYKGNVTVNSVAGCVVIAPDGFTGTITLSYTADEWATAETKGLVCLVPASARTDDYIDSDAQGYYWSANTDPDDASYARSLRFSGDWVYPDGDDYRLYGQSIRLVK